MSIGFTMPFARSSGSVGYLETTENELAAVRENLRSLLLTNWGERVMHSDLGCNLVEFLFEPEEGADLRGRIADRIMGQVTTWMPFVRVEELNVLLSTDDSALTEHAVGLRLKFRLESRPEIFSSINLVVSA